MVLGDSWGFLVALFGSLWLFVALGGSSRVLGVCWLFLVVFSVFLFFFGFFVVLGGSWWFMVVLGFFWGFLVIFCGFDVFLLF